MAAWLRGKFDYQASEATRPARPEGKRLNLDRAKERNEWRRGPRNRTTSPGILLLERSWDRSRCCPEDASTSRSGFVALTAVLERSFDRARHVARRAVDALHRWRRRDQPHDVLQPVRLKRLRHADHRAQLMARCVIRRLRRARQQNHRDTLQ